MGIRKTLVMALAAMTVCASAFAGVTVKGYDAYSDWVKVQVPQIKADAGEAAAKINTELNFTAMQQLYTALPRSNKSEEVMRTSFENAFVGNKALKEERKFIKQVAGFVNYSLHSSWQEAKNYGSSVPGYSLESKYEVLYNGEQLFCVEQLGYLYTGGAHGATLYDVAAFDINTGKKLQLSDMFRPGSDYLARINKSVAAQVAQKPEMFYAPVEVKDGDSFYINGSALVITYPPYEVAPYAAGIIKFNVPLNELADILAVNIK